MSQCCAAEKGLFYFKCTNVLVVFEISVRFLPRYSRHVPPSTQFPPLEQFTKLNDFVIRAFPTRYMLLPPSECGKLELYKRNHPSARHSKVDWSNIEQVRSVVTCRPSNIDCINLTNGNGICFYTIVLCHFETSNACSLLGKKFAWILQCTCNRGE